VKLTKSGKPRKPYVMTPAREEALEKCRLERLANKQPLKHQSVAVVTAPVVAPAKPILTCTPTLAKPMRRTPKSMNFAAKERRIPVRKTTRKRGD
jgi:hypothetical protein